MVRRWRPHPGELGRNIRDLYAQQATHPERIAHAVDDAYIAQLATAVTGGLGGHVGVAPRLFLRKLVADILDRVDEFEDFDPRKHYALTVSSAELSDIERNAAASSADDIKLDMP